MSWVFLAGDRVYKLKKPVRFPYLDFSTLARREAACRAELRLNRALAPDIYLDVLPLVDTGDGLSIGGAGAPVDWLVCMKRLDERDMLDRTHRRAACRNCSARSARRGARAILSLGQRRSFFLRRSISPIGSAALPIIGASCSILVSAFLPAWCGASIDAQRRFLEPARRSHRRARFATAASSTGHGDLRPEHIWLDDKVRIIDCLEFNPRLRAVDPFDEIAFLSLECERLGAAWVGRLSRAPDETHVA